MNLAEDHVEIQIYHQEKFRNLIKVLGKSPKL